MAQVMMGQLKWHKWKSRWKWRNDVNFTQISNPNPKPPPNLKPKSKPPPNLKPKPPPNFKPQTQTPTKPQTQTPNPNLHQIPNPKPLIRNPQIQTCIPKPKPPMTKSLTPTTNPQYWKCAFCTYFSICAFLPVPFLPSGNPSHMIKLADLN